MKLNATCKNSDTFVQLKNQPKIQYMAVMLSAFEILLVMVRNILQVDLIAVAFSGLHCS